MNITVTRVDGALAVDPAPPYITEYLQYFRREFDLVNYQRVIAFRKRLLHTIQPDGSVVTFPGFYGKLLALIEKNGDEVTVVDNRSALPPIDWQAIHDINWNSIGSTGLRGYQLDPIAEFLVKAQNESGIVNAAGGFGKTIVQAVTYAAFNTLPTILAIPLKEVFLQTHDKFAKLFPNKHIGRVGGGYHEISNDITITTFKSLKSCPTEKCKLLLIDELQSVGGDETTAQLCKMTPTRIFGYTATDKGMFNKTEKLVRGVFGERLIYIPYQDAEASNAVVPVTVWMLRMPNDIIVPASSMAGKLSQGIKNCKVRNQLIGQIAAAVPSDWQTLVFVDHIEDHLVQVHKAMPAGTGFIHREQDPTKVGKAYALTAKKQKDIIKDFKANKFKYMIATDAFRAGVDVPNLRVVIQAAGGTSEVELLQEAYRGSRILPEADREALGVSQKHHAVLIDFLDCHDSALESMSRKRMEIYEKQGWTVRTVDAPSQIDWNFYQASQQPADRVNHE